MRIPGDHALTAELATDDDLKLELSVFVKRPDIGSIVVRRLDQ